MENNLVLCFYCDESRPIQHDGLDFFVIGTCYCKKSLVSEIENDVINIKKKYGYDKDYEIKWIGINNKNLNLILELIEYLGNKDGLFIRILIATNKKQEKFKFVLEHQAFYNSMYALLIKKPLLLERYNEIEEADFNVDLRNTHSFQNARNTAKIIKRQTHVNYVHPHILNSKKSQLIQLIDLMIGAASYERINLNTSTNKLKVIEKIRNVFLVNSVCKTTKSIDTKLSIFVWNRGRYKNG